MDKREETGFHVGIEGWLLLVSVVLLICGVVTPVWNALAWTVSNILWYVDVRNWTQLGWFVANVIFLVVMIGIMWWSSRKNQ